jgi:hypothetical protein
LFAGMLRYLAVGPIAQEAVAKRTGARAIRRRCRDWIRGDGEIEWRLLVGWMIIAHLTQKEERINVGTTSPKE